MKAPEKLGVIGSSFGDENGEGGPRLLLPRSEKENYPLTHMIPARYFPRKLRDWPLSLAHGGIGRQLPKGEGQG